MGELVLPVGGMAGARRLGPTTLTLLIGLLAGAATLANLALQLPASLWWVALVRPDTGNPAQMLLAYSFAPRLVTSLLAGAALGLAGGLLQQVLRNPLASPTTLGIEAGANLALAAGLIWAPGLVGLGREWIALVGGVAATGLVLLLARRSGFAPLVVILAGMVVSLTCAALAALLALFNTHYLAGLFLWGAGSLSQQDWSEPAFLLPRLAGAGLAAALLVRPLTLLGLDDASARGLGLSLAAARFGALAVAVALSGCVVAAVGCIGFIGLAAPALARMSGARTAGGRLLASTLISATLLWATDQAVQLAIAGSGEMMVPTGAITALFGAPLLLWMVPRLKLPPHVGGNLSAHSGIGRMDPKPLLVFLAVLLALAVLAALSLGPGVDGWSATLPTEWTGDAALLWNLRLPRVMAALAAGALLAVAGGVLQRITGNPMASPEMLGVSAGAACGLAAALFLLAEVGALDRIVAASLGALLALVLLLALARATQGAPERVILVGIAIGALLDSLVSVLMASGDPRAMLLFGWMTGSTYGVQMPVALSSLGAATLMVLLLPLLARWLDILPLGEATSRALGVPLTPGRILPLVLAAVASAMATLLVGPLSFVGLIAPHLARLLGFRHALAELTGAAVLGALLMVTADFVGRVGAFPWQLPAGLVASSVGAPMFLWLLSRNQASR